MHLSAAEDTRNSAAMATLNDTQIHDTPTVEPKHSNR